MDIEGFAPNLGFFVSEYWGVYVKVNIMCIFKYDHLGVYRSMQVIRYLSKYEY